MIAMARRATKLTTMANAGREMKSMMASANDDDDDGDDDGEGATGDKVDDDGDGATGDDVDDDVDGAPGNDDDTVRRDATTRTMSNDVNGQRTR